MLAAAKTHYLLIEIVSMLHEVMNWKLEQMIAM